MRICIVAQFYPPETGGGGIAAYARYTAIGLRRRGHDVRVISKLVPGSEAHRVVEGIDVYRLASPFQSRRWQRIPVIGRYFRLLRDVLYAWNVRQCLLSLFDSWLPDIVEYPDIDAEGLFHPSVCLSVVKLHMSHKLMRPLYSAKETGYSRYGIELLEALAIRRAGGISSPSSWLIREAQRLCITKDAVPRLVLNPIDPNLFSPGEDSGSRRGLSILYVGRLEPSKGAMVFAEATLKIASEFPQAEFTMIGADRLSKAGGSQKGELQDFFMRHGLSHRVQFFGHDSPESYANHYRNATLFIMPSLLENCPYTLLEAMSCAKPVIVSNAGGMSEMIVNGENGMLFTPGNASEIADVAMKLLSDPTQAIALGMAARKTVLERYSLDVVAESTEKFYQTVLEKSKR